PSNKVLTSHGLIVKASPTHTPTQPMCAEPRPLIVVVEDEEELSKLICQHLEEAGMNVQAYNRTAPALRFLQHNFANLLLLDVNLPDGNGFDLLKQIKEQDINTPTLFLT